MLKIAFKKQLFVLMLLSFVLLIATFVFIPYSFENIAKALTGNYSKTTGATLDFNDWNNLDNDFLDKNSITGDSMSGPLLLPADPTSNLQAATKQYVDNKLAAAGGAGDTFINWGRADCPSGTNLLYNGQAIDNKYNAIGGSSNTICMQSGDAGAYYGSAYADQLYPVTFGYAYQLPLTFAAAETQEVKCAVCFKPQSTCYKNIGSWNCNIANGFNSKTTGYILGGISALATYENQVTRECVNANPDSSGTPNTNWGAIWYAAKISDNIDIPAYTQDAFVKCSICCN